MEKSNSTPIVLMKGITCRFGDVVANDNVKFDLVRGEIHALLGENGAGKSTLMSILYGLYQPQAGEIFVKGKQVDSKISPRCYRAWHCHGTSALPIDTPSHSYREHNCRT